MCQFICSFIAHGNNNPGERLVSFDSNKNLSVCSVVVSDSPVLFDVNSTFGVRRCKEDIFNQDR